MLFIFSLMAEVIMEKYLHCFAIKRDKTGITPLEDVFEISVHQFSAVLMLCLDCI